MRLFGVSVAGRLLGMDYQAGGEIDFRYDLRPVGPDIGFLLHETVAQEHMMTR